MPVHTNIIMDYATINASFHWSGSQGAGADSHKDEEKTSVKPEGVWREAEDKLEAPEPQW